jgi:hypothetical protein
MRFARIVDFGTGALYNTDIIGSLGWFTPTRAWRVVQSMIPKSGYRFSEKDHAPARGQSAMRIIAL